MQLEPAKALYRKHLFSKVRAILLLVIFVNALLIEGLHHHEQEITPKKAGIAYQTKQLNAVKVKCKLCEVLKHHSHFFHLPAACAFPVQLVKPVNRVFVYTMKHTGAYLLACTNKGPPFLTA